MHMSESQFIKMIYQNKVKYFIFGSAHKNDIAN